MLNPRLMGYNFENGGNTCPGRGKRKLLLEIEKKRKVKN